MDFRITDEVGLANLLEGLTGLLVFPHLQLRVVLARLRRADLYRLAPVNPYGCSNDGAVKDGSTICSAGFSNSVPHQLAMFRYSWKFAQAA
jgi:hypothetical protein